MLDLVLSSIIRATSIVKCEDLQFRAMVKNSFTVIVGTVALLIFVVGVWLYSGPLTAAALTPLMVKSGPGVTLDQALSTLGNPTNLQNIKAQKASPFLNAGGSLSAGEMPTMLA